MRKIGIFGGTFNPIHNAHIEIAKAAKIQLGLDFVMVMTGGNPPHKKKSEIPDAKIRHIMVKKALKGMEFLIPCDWEAKRSEYSYTLNTLLFLKKIYPDDELYFIIGGDSYENFHKWYKPEEILKLCTLAVYQRAESRTLDNIKDAVLINGDFLDVSSTMLRQDKEARKKFIPDCVYDFTEKYRLYSDNDMETLLKSMLCEKRYLHSVAVADMCGRLAKKWGADADTAYMSGYLHDIAKDINYTDACSMCDELEAELDPIERHTHQLVHPKLGAELVKCYFGIHEGIITSAIRCHTVGKLGMSVYDKILFVADMCAEGRDFPGVCDIRNTAFENLNGAVVKCIDSTILFNKNKGGMIHPMAYAVKKELTE